MIPLYNTDGSVLQFEWALVGRARPRHVLDVGAHVGNMTRAYLALGAERVVGVEPIPDIYEKLTTAFADDDRVSTLNLAVTDEADYMQHGGRLRDQSVFNCFTLMPAGATALESSPDYRSKPPFTVALSTIDRIANDVGIWPDFIKIDVDGYEAKALRGAERTIHACRPAIMLEVSYLPPLFGDDCAQMIAWVLERDYLIERVDGTTYDDVAAFMTVFPWNTSFDVMLWPPGHVGRPQ